MSELNQIGQISLTINDVDAAAGLLIPIPIG